MTATHGEGAYGNAAGVTTPAEHKMAQTADYVKTGVNTIRPGLLWDGNATVVSGKANMSLDVRAFSIVTQRSATSGVMKWANDATVNLTKDVTNTNLVAPGSNSVYWNVFAWHREFSLDGTNSDPIIAVLVGTPAASPTVPALTSYPGAVSLATVLVPAGTTATNSGTTITQTAPFTATAGGVVPFRNTTERDAGSYVEDQLGWLMDSGTLQIYTGSAWRTYAPSTWVPIVPGAVAGTGVSVSGNTVVLSSATAPDIRGLFASSTFDSYKVSWRLQMSAAAYPTAQLTTGGTPSTGSYYGTVSVDTSGGHTSAPAPTGFIQFAAAAAASTGYQVGEMTLYGPALAAQTQFDGSVTTQTSVSTATTGKLGGGHSVTTPYDGLLFAISGGGTMTGTITFSGLAK